MGDRYLEKLKAFIRTSGLQQERMEDLLRRIKANLPALEEWLSEAEDHWGEEDGRIPTLTPALESLRPAVTANQEGTERGFDESVNARWLECTRPILETFWHTK